ncbi:MAG TPA: radical SAM protein [Polyangia bacterium]|nr:radical SAM protein [Polyangia bacterium]
MKAEALDYGAFSRALHVRARGRRLPVNGSIEVTHRCPLACAHCYNNLPVGDAEARKRELSKDELCRIIDELADAGGLWLLFTGGEIFARADFLDIYKHAKSRGFLVTLFTNGTQITEAIADTLVEWPPFSIEITLYGATRETYERLTRVEGSFDRCMRGIRLLKERGLPLTLKTVAVTINRHEVGDMQRLADALGVGFKFDGMINARIDCSHRPLEVRLSPGEMVQLDLEDPVRAAEWANLLSRRAATPPPKNDTVYHCGGGTSAFAIDPEGKLSICVLSHQDAFDLRAAGFAEAWEDLAKVRARPATRATKCTSCGIREICSTCAATAELEHGDAETPVDYFCEVAHLRALGVGHTPPAHGDCAFCEGGAEHARLLEELGAVQRGMRSGRRHLAVVPESATALRSGCGSGGCGNCGGDTIGGQP